MVQIDAHKEFEEQTRTGFGQDGLPEDVDRDFDAVRGLSEKNKFVCQLEAEVDTLGKRIDQFKQAIATVE